MTEEQIKELGKLVANRCKEYFSNPDNLKKYKEWKNKNSLNHKTK